MKIELSDDVLLDKTHQMVPTKHTRVLSLCITCIQSMTVLTTVLKVQSYINGLDHFLRASLLVLSLHLLVIPNLGLGNVISQLDIRFIGWIWCGRGIGCWFSLRYCNSTYPSIEPDVGVGDRIVICSYVFSFC